MQKQFTLIMGDKKLSSWSLRAWLGLKIAGVDFNEQVIELSRAEILKYSPNGKVPALLHNEFLVWDSLAIIEYIAELFPSANLLPIELKLRAAARSLSCEMHSGFQSLRSLMPFSLRTDLIMPELTPELVSDIERIEQIWLDCRKKYSKTGEYLFNTISIVDIMFAPVVLRFRAYNYKSENQIVQDYCNVILNNKFIQEWLS